MHLDPDLTVFLLTVGVIVFASMPALRRNSVPVPFKWECDEVPSSQLTESQARFFSPYDEKLAAMGYFPVCTYRVRNYAHNLIRAYYNGADTARCYVMAVELTTQVGNVRSLGVSSLLTFHTQYTDGRMFTTRNSKLKSVLDNPPFRIVQEAPNVSDPTKMKALHDARAKELGCPIPAPSTPTALFKAVQEEHERFCAHQVAAGSFKLFPDGYYRLTNKPFWRGIHNFLNPFVHRIPLTKLIPVSLLGAALPVLGIAWLAPAAAQAAQQNGFPPSTVAHLAILTSYMLAGALIGYVLEQHCFVWVFLITYVAVHLVAGLNPGGAYSAFAGWIAHYVGQAKNRSRAILIPQAQPAKARAATA